MLLKLDEQIRPALDCEQQAKPAAETGVSIALSKRPMVDLHWQPRIYTRLENFTLSMFCQSLHAIGEERMEAMDTSSTRRRANMSSKQSGVNLTRRTFIKTAGTAGVTVYVLLSSPAWVGPRIALAANLTELKDTQAKEMLAMARQLFPHDKLGDEYYWVVVESIAGAVGGGQ